MSVPRLAGRPLTLLALALVTLSAVGGCRVSSSSTPDPEESRAIADSIRGLVTRAYDLADGDVANRMLSVYPAEGRVVSATAGRVATTRELLGSAVASFWQGVGRFMVHPTWNWDAIDVDVLSRDAAVMTAQYTVPHWTSDGNAHVIGGVWSAVWQRRGGRWEVTHEHLSDMPQATAESIEATMSPIAPTAIPDSAVVNPR